MQFYTTKLQIMIFFKVRNRPFLMYTPVALSLSTYIEPTVVLTNISKYIFVSLQGGPKKVYDVI